MWKNVSHLPVKSEKKDVFKMSIFLYYLVMQGRVPSRPTCVPIRARGHIDAMNATSHFLKQPTWQLIAELIVVKNLFIAPFAIGGSLSHPRSQLTWGRITVKGHTSKSINKIKKEAWTKKADWLIFVLFQVSAMPQGIFRLEHLDKAFAYS